jgi:ABC-2 type transport system permease protein
MNTIVPFAPSGVSQPAPMRLGRLVRAYLVESKYELLRILRTPGLAIPMLALPTLLYFLLGTLVFGEHTAKDPQLAIYMFASYVVFGATTPGMFGFGMGLAVERQSGMLKLKRAQPMPTGANLFAKLLTALAVVVLVVGVLIAMATFLDTNVTLTTQQLFNVLLASLLGAAACCAIGFFIGASVSGSAATGVVNLIYFPMMYLSGMFFPLPEMLARWAIVWPTFYIDQLVIAAAGGKSFMDASMCVGVLVGISVLFGGLAVRKLGREAL